MVIVGGGGRKRAPSRKRNKSLMATNTETANQTDYCPASLLLFARGGGEAITDPAINMLHM